MQKMENKVREMLIVFAYAITILVTIYYHSKTKGRGLMIYLSVAQTAERWSISPRRIQILCGEGRIPTAIRIGRAWAIPDNAEKPADARIKSGKYIEIKGNSERGKTND